jgi:hypothetical protein
MKSERDPLELLTELDAQAAPSAETGAKIRTACTTDLDVQTPMSRARRIGLSTAVGIILFALMLVLGRASLGATSRAMLLGALGWSFVLLLVLLFGFGPTRGRSAELRVAAAVLLPLGFLMYLSAQSRAVLPLGEFLGHGEMCEAALRCCAWTLAMGAVGAFAVLFLWRRTDPFTPTLTGCMAGLVGGLSVGLPVSLVCPGDETWHLVLGHGLTLVAVVCMGAWIGRKWMSP